MPGREVGMRPGRGNVQSSLEKSSGGGSGGGLGYRTSGLLPRPEAHQLASLPLPPGLGPRTNEWWAEGTSRLVVQMGLGLEAGFGIRSCSPHALCPGDPLFPPEVSEGWCWVRELGVGGWVSGSVGERTQAGEAPKEQVVMGEGKEVQGGEREGGGVLDTWLIPGCEEVRGGLRSDISPATQHVRD